MSRMTDFCDIACDQCSQWEPGTEPLTKHQRRVLKQKGWTTRRDDQGRLEDICPACNGHKPLLGIPMTPLLFALLLGIAAAALG